MRNGLGAAGLVVMLAAGAACGGGGGGGGGANPVVAIAKASAPSGDGQTATVNTTLAAPLRVLVTEDGAPKSAVTVQWSTANGAVNPTSSATGVDGIATTTWTLGTTAGAQTARATLAGATGSPVTFNATGTPGGAAALVKQAGDGQGEAVNTSFATQLQVRVNDQFGNPVQQGVAVQWAGAGTVQPASATTNTNNLGIASVTVNALANAGAGQVQASVSGVAGSVTFNLTVGHRKVLAGNTFFRSARNNTLNPADDTLAVNQTMLWVNQAGTHTVESTGVPSFPNSGTLTLYTVTFPTAGTYLYDCAVHGAAMTGRVVVQ